MEKVSKFFVDENVNIVKGEEASEFIQKKKSQYQLKIDSKKGITQVDEERWQEAQRFERNTWMEKSVKTIDDHNIRHFYRFAHYESLKGKFFKRAIELGCGPFTNMRMISSVTDINKLELLDPLIDSYLEHPFCFYQDRKFGGVFRQRDPRWISRWTRPKKQIVREIERYQAGGIFGKPVVLHNSSIEDFVADGKYDLVVMINVLEHCKDAEKIFSQVENMLTKKGIFVFADKLYVAELIKRYSDSIYDAGHPLQVDKSFIDSQIEKYTPLFKAKLSYQLTNNKKAWDSEVYFIGQKP